jgi:hypothetical protein
MEEKPIRRQPPRSEFVNELEEAPLNANQDFFALLEREMAKEGSKGGASNTREVKPAKKMASYEEEAGDIQLVECSKGCGRQFNV